MMHDHFNLLIIDTDDMVINVQDWQAEPAYIPYRTNDLLSMMHKKFSSILLAHYSNIASEILKLEINYSRNGDTITA